MRRSPGFLSIFSRGSLASCRSTWDETTSRRKNGQPSNNTGWMMAGVASMPVKLVSMPVKLVSLGESPTRLGTALKLGEGTKGLVLGVDEVLSSSET